MRCGDFSWVAKVKLKNNSGLSVELDCNGSALPSLRYNGEFLSHLATVYSEWRQRTIELYQHPTDENMVLSIGFPDSEDWVNCCSEAKDSWAEVLVNGTTVLK